MSNDEHKSGDGQKDDDWDIVFPFRAEPPRIHRRIKSPPIGEALPIEEPNPWSVQKKRNSGKGDTRIVKPDPNGWRIDREAMKYATIKRGEPKIDRAAMQFARIDRGYEPEVNQPQEFPADVFWERERKKYLARLALQRQALTVSHPNDPAEKEADEVADRVMRMGAAGEEREEREVGPGVARVDQVSRSIDSDVHNEETEEPVPIRISEGVSRAATADEDLSVSAESAEQIARVTASGGKPLENAGFFEERMGADFSDVRVHTGADAAKAAEGVNAKAFTLGRDVVFGAGQYRPETSDGQRLIAHELTHTVQQGAANPRGGIFAKLARSVGRVFRQVVMRVEQPEILAPAQIQIAIRENRRLGREVSEGLLYDLYRMTGDESLYRAARNYAIRQNGAEVSGGRRTVKPGSAGIGPDFVKLVALAQKTKLALPETGIIDSRTESSGRLFLRNRPAMIQSAIADIAKNIELIRFRPARSAIVTRLQSMNGAELRDVIGGLTVRFPRYRESGSFALWLFNRLPEFRSEMETILGAAGLMEPLLWQDARRILDKPGAEEASQLLLKRQGAQLHTLIGALLQHRSPRVAAAFLFDEVLSDRLAQEKVRQHFFTQGGIALQFAVEHTAARIVDRIDGYTGLADSYDVGWSFRTTPPAHRNTVLSTLDEHTRAKWGQSAAVALNEDINETAYNQIRMALGVRLPPFDPKLKSTAAKAADVLEYGVIAVEVVAGVLAGIVSGVAIFLWDFVGLAIDLLKLSYYLNMSLFYWLSFGAIGQSEWIAVRDGTLGIIEGLKDPGALFKEAWTQTVSNADTIGGPFEYFRRAEYWTRLIIYFLLTVVTIVKGLIRGGQAAARWAARQRQMARFRRLVGEAEDASHVRPTGEPTRPAATDGGNPERPTRPGEGPGTERPLTDSDTQVPVAEVTKRQVIEIQVGAHELKVTGNGLVYVCSPTCRRLSLVIDNLVETNFLSEGEVTEIRNSLNTIRHTINPVEREVRARELGRNVSHFIELYNAEIQPIINAAKWKQILFVRPGLRRLDETALRTGRLRHLTAAERQAALVEVTPTGHLQFAGGRLIDTNTGKKWLFVLEPNGNIYVFEELTGINHTSILQGRAVSAAGEIRVRNGVLTNVNDQSGHYYPKIENMKQFSKELAERGISTERIRRAGLPRPD